MNNYIEYIKVNLPDTEVSAAKGNGEGCWVLVTNEVKEMHDANFEGGFFAGILDNHSIYYPKLKAGTRIEFEMRGYKRPVAFYNKLQKYRDNN